MNKYKKAIDEIANTAVPMIFQGEGGGKIAQQLINIAKGAQKPTKPQSKGLRRDTEK